LRIDFLRLTRLMVAGALAGFFIFCLFNPSYAREEAIGHQFIFGGDVVEDIKSAIVSAFLRTLALSACFSIMLGGMLVLADEYNSAPRRVMIS